jgi:hypothetical protein
VKGSKQSGLGSFVGNSGKAKTGSGKTAYRVTKQAKTGKFVSKAADKRNPAPPAKETTIKFGSNPEVLTVAAASRIIQTLRNQLAHLSKPQPAAPVTVRVYLDTDDAVKTVKVIKAVDDVLANAGYVNANRK